MTKGKLPIHCMDAEYSINSVPVWTREQREYYANQKVEEYKKELAKLLTKFMDDSFRFSKNNKGNTWEHYYSGQGSGFHDSIFFIEHGWKDQKDKSA